VGEEKLKLLVSIVKGSSYLVVDGGSHRAHMLRENPIVVNDSILAFLAANAIR
jgi:hypothetical protein